MSWKFAYAGQELPLPDSGSVGFELQPIDKADRNANGDMVIESIAMKRKLTASWSRLNGEQTHNLFSVLEKNRIGDLDYYDVAKGSQNKTKVYYGAGVKVNYVKYDDNEQKQIYSAVSINFIEM